MPVWGCRRYLRTRLNHANCAEKTNSNPFGFPMQVGRAVEDTLVKYIASDAGSPDCCKPQYVLVTRLYVYRRMLKDIARTEKLALSLFY